MNKNKIKKSLQVHNKYRALHCIGPLALSSTINDLAQNYAVKLAKTKVGGLTLADHSNVAGYGENIAGKSGYGGYLSMLKNCSGLFKFEFFLFNLI